MPLLLKGHLWLAVPRVSVSAPSDADAGQRLQLSLMGKAQQPRRALRVTQHFEFFPEGFSDIPHCNAISLRHQGHLNQLLGYILLTLKASICSSRHQTLGALPAQTYREDSDLSPEEWLCVRWGRQEQH